MKANLKQIVSVSAMTCAVLLAGCAQQQGQGYTQRQHQGYYNTPAKPAPAAPTAAAPVPAKSGGTVAYFPSGRADGSGLSLEKIAPAEVLAGQHYQYSYKVSNLTDTTLENVQVSDRIGSDFTSTDSDPKPASMSAGMASWNLGSLGPKESKTITVSGSSPEEGVVTTCGVATYNPVVCQDIRVVKANIQLTKTEPADQIICDPIPVVLTVKNNGSSPLTGVQITDNLPAGVTSDGKSSLKFNIGDLAPGESKGVKYNTMASTTGRFVNTATATSAQGVSAEASAVTTVHQPVLAVSCKATQQQYFGRKFDVNYTVSNTGDAPAAGTKLQVAVPAGVRVDYTTGNGQVGNGGKTIEWDLGTLDTSSPQTVGVTFIGFEAGMFDFTGTAKGSCAAAVSTSCSTKIVGIAAILLEKSDDPDPVGVGDTTTYTVKVTNQGSADDSNVQVVVSIAPELVPVSTSEGSIDGQTVTLPMVATLPAKQSVTYKILAKGVKAGDGHTKFTLTSAVLTSPITAEESTTVY